MNENELKILRLFNKTQGIEKMGEGDFDTLCEKMGLPKKGWEEISRGFQDGNFDHLYYEGKHYYSYIVDPLTDTDTMLIFQTHGQRNHKQLIDIVNRYYQTLDLLREKPFEEKTCWECGRKFTFLSMEWDKELPTWEAFERAMDCWKDSHCGCK